MYHEIINNATKQYPFLIEHINVKYIPHFHEEIELVYVLEGTLGVTIGDNSLVLNRGEICIITPDLIHNLCSYEYNKTFVMKLFPIIDIGSIRLKNNVITPKDENYGMLREYITDMMLENEKRDVGYELSVNISAEKIFLMILRNMKYEFLENKSKSKLASQNEFLNRVTAFLEEHYADEFSLEEIAKHLSYTKSYFCHYFKQITGVSFWRYYTIFRLEKAVWLMQKHPKKKLIEIAGSAGFKNIRSFNQAFKEYHRCTPREYNKKYYETEQKTIQNRNK